MAARPIFALIASIACVIVTSGSVAATDAWDPVWSVPTKGYAVAVDADGRIYVTGRVDRPDGYAMVLEKYSSHGRRLWRTTWRRPLSPFSDALGRDVAVAPDGRTAYVAGAEFLPPGEHARSRLWAYSARGRLRWVRTIWGPSSFEADAVVARRSGAVVGGTTTGEVPRPVDGRIAAFDLDGTRLWENPFEAPGYDGTSDTLGGLVIGERGRIYAVGSVDAIPITIDDFFEGKWSDQDVVVQQLSGGGRTRWTWVLADPGVKDVDEALAVDAVGDRIFVGGRLDAREGGRGGRAWLGCLSPSGRLRWSRLWGPVVRPSAAAFDVATAPWRAVYVTGYIRDDLYLRRYSLTGVLRSDRRSEGVGGGVGTSRDPAVYVTSDSRLSRMPP